jgi:hypothetical protein
MANHYTIRGGIDSTALYKEESIYATDPGTWTAAAKHFGVTQKVTPSISRGLIKTRGLAGVLPTAHTIKTARDAQSILPSKSDLTVDIEYQPQDFSFLKYVLGSSSTAATTTTYPQATASTDGDKRKYLTVPSIILMQRFDFGGTVDSADTVLKFTGLKVNSWELRASLGDPISCSAGLTGSNVLYDQTTVSTSYPYVALGADDVYHFVESQIAIGATTIPNLIDGITITVGNNAQGLGDVRSYVNEAVVIMDRDFSLKVDMNQEHITYLKNMLGGTGAGLGSPAKIDTITVTLTKGTKVATFTFKDLKQNDGIPGTDYGSINKENIVLEAELMYVTENIPA